jgi:hypothetical protein
VSAAAEKLATMPAAVVSTATIQPTASSQYPPNATYSRSPVGDRTRADRCETKRASSSKYAAPFRFAPSTVLRVKTTGQPGPTAPVVTSTANAFHCGNALPSPASIAVT